MRRSKRIVSKKQVTVRLDDTLTHEVEKASEELGLTTAEVIRESLRGNINSRKTVNISQQDRADMLTQLMKINTQLSKLHVELSRQGNNLNQLTHASNVGKMFPEGSLLATDEVLQVTQHRLLDLSEKVTDLWQLFE